MKMLPAGLLLFVSTFVAFAGDPQTGQNVLSGIARTRAEVTGPASIERHPDLWIVGYRKGVSRQTRSSFYATMGAEKVYSFRRIAADVIRTADLPDADVAVRTLSARPEIRYIEPNYRVSKSTIPDDPRFAELWGLRNDGQDGGVPGVDIAVTNVWATYGTGSTNIIVAVIDTGIDYTHEDLAANMWINPGEIPGNEIDDDGNGIVDDVHGARWVNGDGLPTSGDPMDDNEHGTHVAGTIGGAGNNGIGVAGVNWQVRLMALKFLDNGGGGYIADAVSALEYAIDKGARLSNNSWGGGGFSQAMKDMIDSAAAAGQLFVAAAGNSSSNNDDIPQYPTTYACANILSVASGDRLGARSDFSCYGRNTVHLAAPGSSIVSSVPGNNYASFNGTSMATPHVAGGAALLWSLFPEASYESIKQWLLAGVRPMPAWINSTISGGHLRLDESARLAHLPAEILPAGSFSATSEVNSTSIELSWTKPAEATGVIIRRGEQSPPVRWDDGAAVYDGAAASVSDAGLAFGQRFYYAAWAYYVDGIVTSYSAAGYANARVGGDPDDYFTEFFQSHDVDLGFMTVTFRTNGSLNRYEAFADEATVFPVDPAGGTVLNLSDDDCSAITLAAGHKVQLYGVEYDQFFICDNGYITFGQPDWTWDPGTSRHFEIPRISAFFGDIIAEDGGTISWKELDDRFVVTYENVPEWYRRNVRNNFQAELFYDGTIRLTWLDMGSIRGLVGLSEGAGQALNFVSSNLSEYPSTDLLRVTPRMRFESSAFEGGPFDPDGTSYTITNASDAELGWSLVAKPDWLDVDPAGGTLGVGTTTNVMVSFNQAASNLSYGVYEGSLVFSNHVSGRVHVRQAQLLVARPGFTALYLADGMAGIDHLYPALLKQGYRTRRTEDKEFFNQQLVESTNRLVIAFRHADIGAIDTVALGNHLDGGGRAIAADWTRDAELAAVLEAAYSGSRAASPVTIHNDTLADGISNPFDLINPGWGTWLTPLRAIGDAESVASFPDKNSALVWGRGGRSAMLGFLGDTVNDAEGQVFYENLLGLLEDGYDDLRVRPAEDWSVSGYELGPFDPAEKVYVLTNAGAESVSWSAGVTSSWAEVMPASGVIEAGAVGAITVRVVAAANTLLPGSYEDELTVQNTGSGVNAYRALRLRVIPLPGEINVSDSLAPTNDLRLPFEETIVGLSRTAQITIHNVNAQYDLVVDSVSVMTDLGAGMTNLSNSSLSPTTNPSTLVPEANLSLEHVPDSLLVGFTHEALKTERATAHAAVGALVVKRYRHVPVESVSLPRGTDLKAAIATYLAQPGVAYAEPNYIVRATGAPDDPQFESLWGLHNTGQEGGIPGADIDALNAWSYTTGSTNVVVAVIDTGIDYNHEDLAANMWNNPGEIPDNNIDDDGNGIVDDVYGARWVDGIGAPTSGDPMDGAGHGSHCAGTIGGVGNNGVGVAGVNWSVRLMALKFLSDDGFGSNADAISAIEYAIDKGAHLSNNSWGGGGYSQALKDAIDAAGEANQLFIAAAGNSSSDNDADPHYPSSYESSNIVAVASSDRYDEMSSFSCYGLTSVDLAAPGSSILSTTPGDQYSIYSGTSMATPHVSGAAALLLSLNPDAPYAAVKEALMMGADRLDSWNGLTVTGGRLNVATSLSLLNPNFHVAGTPAVPFSVPPGGSVTFDVIYAPVEAGSHTGFVRIVSNDTNAPIVDVDVEGNAVNDDLDVSPAVELQATGWMGGPFAPAEQVYVLTNNGVSALTWTASNTDSWLVIEPAFATLPAGAAQSVTVAVNQAVAALLPGGTYQDSVTFMNTGSGGFKVRRASLTVQIPLCDVLDNCELNWQTGGDAEWTGQTSVTHDGVDAGQSGAIADDQSSWMETTVTGPGEISFWWKVSSEQGWDYLEFYLDGQEQSSISGEVDWESRSFVVPSGMHTLRWVYAKDSSVDNGSDRGWLDQVVYTPLADANDHAGNYTVGTFVHGANEGEGFQPWTIITGSGATATLASSTTGSGNIDSTNGLSFRFYGGNGTYVDAIRPFAQPLLSGDVFRVTIAYNWNGGARGVNILAEDGSELANINYGGGNTLSFKWGNTDSETISTAYLSTAILHIAFTQLDNHELQVRLDRNDGFSFTQASSGLWANAAKVKFYNGGHAADNVNYALFANNLVIQRNRGPDADQDGLPDEWEQQYFGGSVDPASPAANTNYTVWQMYVADLDPTNPSAAFPPAEATPSPGGLMEIVVDPSSTARVYLVQWSTNLMNEVWSQYGGVKSGTGAAVSFTVTNDVPGRTYRTGVQLPE